MDTPGDNEGVFGSGNQLTVARLTLVMLFAMAGRVRLLMPARATLGARRADDHGCC
jgi:hypothetical protein